MNARLKQLLSEKSMRPEQLALMVGVSVGTLGRLDPVKAPRRPLALALVAATGLNWDELFPKSMEQHKIQDNTAHSPHGDEPNAA